MTQSPREKARKQLDTLSNEELKSVWAQNNDELKLVWASMSTAPSPFEDPTHTTTNARFIVIELFADLDYFGTLKGFTIK